MKDAEPRFEQTSRVAVSTRLDALHEEEKKGVVSGVR